MDKNAQHKRAKTRQCGFTLVEFILSLTVVAFVIGILGTGFHILGKGWAVAGEKAEHQDMFIRGLAIIRRDIEGLERQIITQGNSSGFLFIGLHDSLRFVVIEPPYPTRAGLYLIQYSPSHNREKLALMRSRQLYNLNENEPLKERRENEVALLEGDYIYRFSYKAELSSQSAWSDHWNIQNQLPSMIRFEIIDASSGGPVLPPFIIRLRHDVEQVCLTKNSQMCTRNLVAILQDSDKRGDNRGGGDQ